MSPAAPIPLLKRRLLPIAHPPIVPTLIRNKIDFLRINPPRSIPPAACHCLQFQGIWGLSYLLEDGCWQLLGLVSAPSKHLLHMLWAEAGAPHTQSWVRRAWLSAGKETTFWPLSV